MNGAHIELYSWDLFQKEFSPKPQEQRNISWRIESNKVFKPFSVTWYYVSNSEEYPVIVLEGWHYGNADFQIDIGYKEEGFYIVLYESEQENYIMPNEIKTVLKRHGFDSDNTKYSISFNSVLSEIVTVCSELKILDGDE